MSPSGTPLAHTLSLHWRNGRKLTAVGLHDESLPAPHESVPLTLLVSLPPSYPDESPPQLQLLSRYLGAFGVDAPLFGAVLRTYLVSVEHGGVPWESGNVCVFDGVQSVLERCAAWYEDRLSREKAGEMVREEAREAAATTAMAEHQQHLVLDQDERGGNSYATSTSSEGLLPESVQIVQAEPIMDRKSAFVGRACKITDPSQVPLILAYLQSDRAIARAAHPVINAWRCTVGGVVHQDNNDDGETAAGGRLAHLLQILDVDNVLVIVTRYFGGIHLGPDRFKHINQAARNALELGGFLDEPTVEARKGPRGGKKKA